MSQASERSAVRAQALEVAGRAVASGSPVGHFLSSARMFDRYITTGLSQSGPNRIERMVVGTEGVIVEVDGHFDNEQAEAIETGVLAAIARAVQ